MNNKSLTTDLQLLYDLQDRVEKFLSEAPEGRVHVDSSKGQPGQFYWIIPETKKECPRGKYLRKDELTKAAVLAQKEYSIRFQKELLRQIRIAKRFSADYDLNRLVQIADKMPAGKRALIRPYLLSNQEYLEQWFQEHPGEQNKLPYADFYMTENGERVRSKTEKLVADLYAHRGIIYRYEAPLQLQGYQLVYPDFTILNLRQRKTIYHEHFGMMDNQEYCKKALERIELYGRNGIWMGDRLLITMESSKKGIYLEQVEKMIEMYML